MCAVDDQRDLHYHQQRNQHLDVLCACACVRAGVRTCVCVLDDHVLHNADTNRIDDAQ